MDSKVIGDESVTVLVYKKKRWGPRRWTGRSACRKEEETGLPERGDVAVSFGGPEGRRRRTHNRDAGDEPMTGLAKMNRVSLRVAGERR